MLNLHLMKGDIRHEYFYLLDITNFNSNSFRNNKIFNYIFDIKNVMKNIINILLSAASWQAKNNS